MLVETTEIPDVRIITPKKLGDNRGWVRPLVHGHLVGSGISESFDQFNVTMNYRGATRGMHWQPGQSKLCMVVSGEAHDVILDVRRNSPTFGKIVKVSLNAIDGKIVYVPEGCAHGFQALEDQTIVLYFMSTPWKADEQRCVAIEDPHVDFDWPIPLADAIIAEKDRKNPDLRLLNYSKPGYLPLYTNGSR
jgi:dTDP-4-dehydrorhamnose 3,5-epimerase